MSMVQDDRRITTEALTKKRLMAHVLAGVSSIPSAFRQYAVGRFYLRFIFSSLFTSLGFVLAPSTITTLCMAAGCVIFLTTIAFYQVTFYKFICQSLLGIEPYTQSTKDDLEGGVFTKLATVLSFAACMTSAMAFGALAADGFDFTSWYQGFLGSAAFLGSASASFAIATPTFCQLLTLVGLILDHTYFGKIINNKVNYLNQTWVVLFFNDILHSIFSPITNLISSFIKAIFTLLSSIALFWCPPHHHDKILPCLITFLSVFGLPIAIFMSLSPLFPLGLFQVIPCIVSVCVFVVETIFNGAFITRFVREVIHPTEGSFISRFLNLAKRQHEGPQKTLWQTIKDFFLAPMSIEKTLTAVGITISILTAFGLVMTCYTPLMTIGISQTTITFIISMSTFLLTILNIKEIHPVCCMLAEHLESKQTLELKPPSASEAPYKGMQIPAPEQGSKFNLLSAVRSTGEHDESFSFTNWDYKNLFE